jgi:hypothetical protein
MMRIILSLLLASTLFACAQARYAQTSVEQAVDNPVTQSYAWGEVHCPQGTVCAEIEVLRVDIEPRTGGRIEVTLHNRTGESVVAQIALEILDAQGVRLDKTNFQDVPLAPRQEQVWDMPGVYQENAKVRVVMRARRG